MPSLTISTDTTSPSSIVTPQSQPQTQSQSQPHSRSSSPVRPPVSPITPTLAPVRLPSGPSFTPRQTFTHTQPNQVAAPPPAPVPITLDANPDALALRSAISILQLQRQRALADIQTLSRAKDEALNEPEAFLDDLVRERVRQRRGEVQGASDESDDDESDPAETSQAPTIGSAGAGGSGREWTRLPAPQSIVRCPPINWSQYAVVGESLDKLHVEQRSRPSEGVPATMGPGGTYEFGGEGDRKPKPLVGIAAPYTPGRDKLVDRKPKTGKKGAS